ncbi:hypothetical protein ACELLULO517_15505 [Acidisoma cellulosilytica]|uniref:Uncharacterized protein n=1 Tax=Acidisoma cellulosilyticum TaxID=2802395 RepID=A0A964E4G0_9PROT|nr:hypothetical protein [Acidisoma cellulosilyticum]MCB8881655.1 hypothetical protein [Acidisoma cellulosilyticum]
MLTAWISQAVSLINAPIVFAWVALVIQAAPAAFLLSRRMAEAIPSQGKRLFLAALLIAVPGMHEVYVNTTDSQWHLSLLAFLVLTAATPRNSVEKLFDTLVLLIAGLSGPFSAFLAPPALIWWFWRRSRWNFWRACLVIATALVQLSLIVLHHASRGGAGAGLGASIPAFANILLINVVGVATFGAQRIVSNGWGYGFGWISNGDPVSVALSLCLTLAALGTVLTAFLRGPLILRLFLIFVSCEFAAGLIDSLRLANIPAWQSFEANIAYRYAFHPICAWLVVLVACACSRIGSARWLGSALLACTVLLAVPSDWGLPPLPQATYRAFHHDAKVFARLPAGTAMSFPERPGDSTMNLVKH